MPKIIPKEEYANYIDQIEQMIQMLPIEKKRELLKKLQSQYFLQFYQENYYQDKELPKQLVKKEYFIKNN